MRRDTKRQVVESQTQQLLPPLAAPDAWDGLVFVFALDHFWLAVCRCGLASVSPESMMPRKNKKKVQSLGFKYRGITSQTRLRYERQIRFVFTSCNKMAHHCQLPSESWMKQLLTTSTICYSTMRQLGMQVTYLVAFPAFIQRRDYGFQRRGSGSEIGNAKSPEYGRCQYLPGWCNAWQASL